MRYLFFILVALQLMLNSACSSSIDVVPSTSVSKEQYMDPKTYSIVMSIPENDRDYVLSKRKASREFAKYVSLHDNQYSIDLTLSQARELGISDTIYNDLVKEIENLNRIARNPEEYGDTLILDDLQKAARMYDNPEVHYNPNYFRPKKLSRSNYGTPIRQGRLAADSELPVTTGFETTNEMKEIVIECYPKYALFPIYIVKFSTGGTDPETKVVKGKPFCSQLATFPFKLTGKNIWAKIEFKTSDVNGGACIYKVY